MKSVNVLIAGVGGQGSLLASKILGTLFGSAGMAVKVSEVHGMSQRGGSVVTYVRGGQDVAAPLIAPGMVDILIAMEQLEALRWLHTLKPDGIVVASTQKILPMPVIDGREKYPENIEQTLASKRKTVMADAQGLAIKAGSPRSSNVVLLGAVSNRLPFTPEQWQSALRACIKPPFWEANEIAFSLGRG